MISFFVTARLAAQADSTAFTDSLLDQLAAVTGEQVPPVGPATMRDQLRRQLLEKAAARAVKAGMRLVLVVDGLDEDCGSLPGSGLPSIAACLPKRPPDGLRIIVAGRPDPPVPADVDPAHPLHQCPVRTLDVSPHATRATQLAQLELDEVLATDRHRHNGLGYQVLGLVAVSGGGLGDRDLQQLTGRPAFEIDRLLNGVFGRTIAGRHASARAFLFTHETLRVQAIERLGPDTLARFAERLHAWADGYRHRHWPEDTPKYLQRGYPRMLADARDASRLAALAADTARHEWMLHTTGGDAAALAEIAAAQALIAASTSPDLLAALRLAWHRDQLEDRNANIPVELPAVWAAVGQPAHAEALARSITGRVVKARALAAVASTVADAGDCDRARELAKEAERTARSITDQPQAQALALAAATAAAAGAGDHAHARELAAEAERRARSITTDAFAQPALAAVAVAAADVGDYARTERIARSITNAVDQARALAAAAAAAAGAGDHAHARELAAEAERIARSATNAVGQPRALAAAVTAAAGVGDYARARELAADAERTAQAVTSPFWRARALAAVALAAAGAGDYDRARELTAEAERTARSVTDMYLGVGVLADVARAAADVGDYNWAERIAHSVTELDTRARALAAVAAAAAGAGDCDRAQKLAADSERTARSITDPTAQMRTLASMARAAAAVGDHERAGRIARSIADPADRAAVLASVARTADDSDYDWAEWTAQSDTDLYPQKGTLAAVAIRGADPAMARSRIAGALADGGEEMTLEALALIDPAVLSAFADELTGIPDPPRRQDNGPLSGTSAAYGRGYTGGLQLRSVRDSRTLFGTSCPWRRRGRIVRRTITIVFGETLPDEKYADLGNSIWGVLRMARPAGGFHLESDSASQHTSHPGA